MSKHDRRELLKIAGLSMLGYSASGWAPMLANEVNRSQEKRHFILLWMSGGPAQTDTFDMKPSHTNGGEFKEVSTCVPGLRFSEHLPKLGTMSDRIAVIRSLSTKEGDHGRGTYLMLTGHQPMGPIRYPNLSSNLSKELGSETDALPNYVSISPYRAFNQAAFSPGFLGPRYAPLTVGATDQFQAQQANQGDGYAELNVDDLRMPGGMLKPQFEERIDLWRTLQDSFMAKETSGSPKSHNTVYQRAIKLINSQVAKGFDLTEESSRVRDRYGRGRFGQGCLMARRLIERGVSCVEVSLGFGNGTTGWDTHANNFATVKQLSAELDSGWGMLMQDLAERGLLESTTILWMGEFGRTPKINRNGGRDHFPAAWSCAMAGAGINGGQTYGKTSEDGLTVEDGKVDVGDVLATLCTALKVSPEKQNLSNLGRPIRIAEGDPIAELLA